MTALLLPTIEDVIARALGQKGYVESGGSTGHNGNIVHFWPDDGWAQYQGGSWCAAFITWLFLPWADDGWIRYLECNQGERLFRQKGKFFTDPAGIRRGDILFHHFAGEPAGPNHTSYALADAAVPVSKAHTIEGNTSPSDKGSQANGGGVYEKDRPFGTIHGYGRPDYATSNPSVPTVEFTLPAGRGFIDMPGGAGGWAYAADGGVFTVGAAPFFGSMGGKKLNQPVVGAAPTPTGKGYWLVAADGGVFAYGDARFVGSAGNVHLNSPIVAMAATRTGGGYWLVAADGGVFAYGDAPFFGAMGGHALNAPILFIEPTPTGQGYWLLGRDGGVFAFGDAPAAGSMAGRTMAAPPVALVTTRTGKGYAIVGADGGIFNFGDAAWAPYKPLLDEYKAGQRTIIGADTTPAGTGLEMVSNKLETYVR